MFFWEPQLTSLSSLTSSHFIRHTVPAGSVHPWLRGGRWTCVPRVVHWAGWDLCEGWQGRRMERNSQVWISFMLSIKLLTSWQTYSCAVMKMDLYRQFRTIERTWIQAAPSNFKKKIHFVLCTIVHIVIWDIYTERCYIWGFLNF